MARYADFEPRAGELRCDAQLRRARVDDLPALAALLAAQTGTAATAHAERMARIVDAPDRHRLLLAECDGAVCGYGRASRFRPDADAPANIAPAGFYLAGLVVAPAARRHGLGAALTEARLAWVATRAVEAFYVANAHNRASIALHARYGFTVVTSDVVMPGVTFEDGRGLLFRAVVPYRVAQS